MIFDFAGSPKGVTLVRLNKADRRPTLPFNVADLFPLWPAGTTDARQWRPDIVTSQSMSADTVGNTSPIASGAVATNHTRKSPRTMQFECLITDTPLVPTSIGAALAGVTASGSVRRSESILAGLMELRDSRAFVAVLSNMVIFETARISNITVPRAPNDGGSYRIQISLEEVQTFQLEILASVDDIPARLGASGARSGGVVVG